MTVSKASHSRRGCRSFGEEWEERFFSSNLFSKFAFYFVVAFLEEFSLSVGPFATLPLCLPCSALLLHMHILFDLNTFQPVLLAYLSCTVALVNAIYSSISNLMRFTAILWPKQTTQSREQEHRRGRQNLDRHETETLIFDLFEKGLLKRFAFASMINSRNILFLL